MNGKSFSWVVRIIAVLVLAVGTSAQAQAPTPKHLSGIINDYTPATGVRFGFGFRARGRCVTSPPHKCDGFSNHACDTFRYVTV